MIKGLKFASSVLVGVVAVSALVMLAMHFGLIPGFKAYVLLSGSMMPALDPGSVVLVKQKPFGYSVGDIVTFKSKGEKMETTHRISALEAGGSRLLYQTKGDANKQPDQQLVAYEDVVGSLVWTMPYLGYAVNFAKTPKGFILLVIIPATIVIYEELKTTKRELGQQLTKLKAKFWVWREKRQRNDLLTINLLPKKKPRIAYEVAVVPILGAAMMFMAVSGSWFSDLENSVGNILGAASSFGPPIAQTLVMNELLPLSSCNQGQTNGQFLELWNGSGASVNLQNFKLTDGTDTIAIANSNTSLPNGAFAILVKSEGVIQQCLDGDVNGAVTVNLGGNIDLNTNLLRLLDADDVVIDTIEWNGITGLTPNIDESIERDPTGHDSVIGTNFEPGDFVVRTTPTPGI